MSRTEKDLLSESARGRKLGAVMVDHKDYGHKRIALELKMGHNRIRRVMKKYTLKPYRRRHKKWVKKKDVGKLP